MATRAKHGTRTKYVAGCRCGECNEANTIYQQNLKDRKRTTSLTALPGRGAGAPTPPETETDAPGRVESQVLQELQTLSAAPKQPGLVAAVLQMAKIMDAPGLATTHPSAMRQLTLGLDKLRAASAGRAGKLATVAAMSQRTSSDKTG